MRTNYKRASLTELIDALLEQERHPDLKLIELVDERGLRAWVREARRGDQG